MVELTMLYDLIDTVYIYCQLKLTIVNEQIQRGMGGGQAKGPDYKMLNVFLEILFRTDSPREAIGPEGPIASRGRSIWPSVKYVQED